MNEAWVLYFDNFRARAARVADQQFGRGEAYAEAAHDAYQSTADHLTRAEGWTDDRTLNVMRGLNQATQQWIEKDGGSWDDLRARLEGAWRDLTAGEASPPRHRGGDGVGE